MARPGEPPVEITVTHPHIRALITFSVLGMILGLVMLILVPVIPFTEQFARETVPRAQWSSPDFKKINRVLSAAWGVAIVAIGVSRLAAAGLEEHTSRRLPDLLLGLPVPVSILIYMLKFSQRYPDQVTGRQPKAPAAGWRTWYQRLGDGNDAASAVMDPGKPGDTAWLPR